MQVCWGTLEDLAGLFDGSLGSRRPTSSELNEHWVREYLEVLVLCEIMGWNWGYWDCWLMPVEGLFLSSLKEYENREGVSNNWGNVDVICLQSRSKDKAWDHRQVPGNSVGWVLLEIISAQVKDKKGTVSMNLPRVTNAWPHCLLW